MQLSASEAERPDPRQRLLREKMLFQPAHAVEWKLLMKMLVSLCWGEVCGRDDMCIKSHHQILAAEGRCAQLTVKTFASIR